MPCQIISKKTIQPVGNDYSGAAAKPTGEPPPPALMDDDVYFCRQILNLF